MTALSKTEERGVLTSLLEAYPGFLSENLDWNCGPDPPDFIATSVSGHRFGLEMTEWLNESQTTVSTSNQNSRMMLLGTLDSEHAECPSPIIRVLICDRVDVPFRKWDRNEYVREVYQLGL